VAITGVSDRGKSTLVHDVLYRSLARPSEPEFDPEAEISGASRRRAGRSRGAERIASTIMIDQSPIGRTPRSNPVTYIKAFDVIRALFASTREAESAEYSAGHFSFNIPGGRCEVCQGDGTVTVEMQFLADVELVCEECKGTRYKSGILEIRYNGLNIHQVLQLTVREAMDVFRATPRLVHKLKVLDRRGSGLRAPGPICHHALRRRGAAREAGGAFGHGKLREHAVHLRRAQRPGLHFDDISKLLSAFQRLIENGGSLIVIEHNLDVTQGGRLGDRSRPGKGGARRVRGSRGNAGNHRQG